MIGEGAEEEENVKKVENDLSSSVFPNEIFKGVQRAEKRGNEESPFS